MENKSQRIDEERMEATGDRLDRGDSPQMEDFVQQRMTRRKLLAAVGAMGAAAIAYGASFRTARAAGSVTEAVYGEAEGKEKSEHEKKTKPPKPPKPEKHKGDFVKTTLAALRAMEEPDRDVLYYITDPGQEGHFYYDAADTAATDNTGTVLVSAAGGHRFKRIIESDFYSVKWFGAKGDGATDDLDIIRAAILAVFNLGGGTLYFPPGTYIVSPSLQKRHIPLKSNVNLQGAGSSSIIKVKDNAGDYWTIFGDFQTWPNVKNVKIRGLKFDQNPQNNLTCNIDLSRTDTYYWAQFCISLFDYDNILVEDCIFDPICGMNTVIMNNANSKNASVNNCQFNFVAAKGAPNYDNSAVYMNGRRHTVTNCKFYAAPGQTAFGAIETHTGQSVVSGNVSDGYITGVHIQASETSGDHADITVSNNTFTNAVHAIQLWTYKQHSIKNVTIAGNTVSIANADKKRTMMVGIGAYPGFLPADYTGTFENITITGNTILFQEEFVKRELLEGFCYGIGFVRETDVKNVVISNNIIKNSPMAAIHIGNTKKVGTMANLQIAGNVIVNAAHYPAANEAYRAAILLRSTVINAKISDNMIIETYDPGRGLYSIRLNATDGTFTGVEVTGNQITSKQGGLWLDLNASVKTDAAEKYIKYSEKFLDDPLLEAGTTYQAGTIVFVVKTGTAGAIAPIGYKVLTGGTFGALGGVTATGRKFSSVVTVNDASQLKVGQWILILAGNQERRIVHIAGNELRVNAALTAEVLTASAVSYLPPSVQPFGQPGKLPAQPDTNGSTVEQLEAELNQLKQALRNFGLMA
ncbi:glycosyl hydrolase family 28-related protein [Paenibacillus contaminans]|uniref:Rhamnogalacturonase A/B/Epimerase-like pectate lyase domain-containing protein n=1 Tax=Paenibacillus contaminans TaxID=450362 RepID=A0A329MI68_9BACL|nr:right-handed parallel beta-helix repeat-containing protein [Paenibacillus contaminans]RAV19420.1 hypothetical protein DQG23_20715 [Paenibacillus contaminans]